MFTSLNALSSNNEFTEVYIKHCSGTYPCLWLHIVCITANSVDSERGVSLNTWKMIE